MTAAVLYRLGAADRPVTLRQLATWTGLSRRDTEAAVQQLRLEGHPVCSSSEGIWLAKDQADALSAYRALRRRVVTQSVTARALLRAAQRMENPEQPSFGL